MNSRIRHAFFLALHRSSILVPLLLVLLMSTGRATAAPDTTWYVSFQVNMSKAVKDNIFHADSDFVYVVLDHGVQPLKLVPGPGYTYSGTLYNELDSNQTYNYKFRINDSTWETVNRQVTPQPGMVNISVWWNDDPINITTFIVNMTYATQYGLFNPATDSVSIAGSMNNWQGSPKFSRMGTSLNYSYDKYSLAPGSVHQYKYRINQGDTALNQIELLFQPNRLVRIPDTLLEVSSDFNNYNPARRLMTFNCDMAYYIGTHRFDPLADYLDVAGSFNGGGSNDALFDSNNDSVYTLGLYLDTAYIHQGPLAFKFRINGSWSSAELQNKPNRNYAFHDTTGQNPNTFGCWYNDMDPSVPTPPWAYNVAIQGPLIHKHVLSGSYTYEDLNGIPEDSSSYRWYRSLNAAGDSIVAIDSATKITYRVDTLDIGKWLIFEVTPRAAYGDSAVGKPVRVISGSSIGGVGVNELSSLITRVYPNPAADLITVEAKEDIERIEIISLSGRNVMTAEGMHTRAVRLQVSHLPKGNYLLKATARSRQWGVVQVVKQ